MTLKKENMKKILYSFMMLFVATLCFTACSDDDDDNGSIVMPSNPEKDIAGTYSGTWTTTNQTSGAVSTGAGTITIAATDSAYVADLIINECTDANVSVMKSVVNVDWRTNNTYSFFNKTSTNELGGAFAGKVIDGKTLELSFNKVVRSGRKSVTYNYSFVGTKQ